MVGELDINDQDVTNIADMIDEEISSLVPGWRSGPEIEESARFINNGFCNNCASNHTSTGSLLEFLSHNMDSKNLQIQCLGCASLHGRFEEITYQVEETEHHHVAKNDDNGGYREIWNQRESRELSSISSSSEATHTDEDCEKSDERVITKIEAKNPNLEDEVQQKLGLSLREIKDDNSKSSVYHQHCSSTGGSGKTDSDDKICPEKLESVSSLLLHCQLSI